MEWKVLIHPSVAAEMEEAVLWYSLKSSGKSRCITLYVHVFAVKQSKFRHSPFQKQEVDLVVKRQPLLSAKFTAMARGHWFYPTSGVNQPLPALRGFVPVNGSLTSAIWTDPAPVHPRRIE